MDSITQAVLGASIGEAILGKKIGAKGAAIGAVIATIPDLDVFLHLMYEKYDMLSIHRGYSHSILFSFIGAILLAYLLKKCKWTQGLGYMKLYVFCWLTLFTHMILDAFTAYGTLLLLPFSDRRVSWDSINVIDPVYTLPMVIGLFISIFFYNKKLNRSMPTLIGLLLSTLYLVSTLGVKHHVNSNIERELIELKIPFESLTTIPVGIASLSWYGIARTTDTIYLQKYSLFSEQQTSFDSFPINHHLLETLPVEMAEKMRWFAKNNFVVYRDGGKIRIYNLQVDLRGVVEKKGMKFPTAGYFEVTAAENDEFLFSSGVHLRD